MPGRFLTKVFALPSHEEIDRGMAMLAHSSNPSCTGGRGRRIVVQGWPKKKCESLSEKQTKERRTWGVAQVEALSSNPQY
jgi:hypothetical protein